MKKDKRLAEKSEKYEMFLPKFLYKNLFFLHFSSILIKTRAI